MTAKNGNFGAPADQAVAVTKSDVTVLAPTRAIYVGTAGNITVKMAGPDENVLELANVPSGSILPLCVTQVRAATTASNIVALF